MKIKEAGAAMKSADVSHNCEIDEFQFLMLHIFPFIIVLICWKQINLEFTTLLVVNN